GLTVEEMVINYAQLSKAFDELAKRSNKIWYIDRAKQFWFVDRTITLAPVVVIASDITRNPEIASSLAEASPMYRNRQYGRAGQATTSIQQTETRTGDGETVAFTMGFPIAKVPEVKKTPPGLPLQTMGIRGIDDIAPPPAVPKECYWNKGDAVITFETAPGIGEAIEVKYYGLYDLMVRVESIPKQLARQAVEGGTGIIETLDDFPGVSTKDDAIAAVNATLAHYGVIGKQFTFPLRKWGLEPGQMAEINSWAYDLHGTFLVPPFMIFANNTLLIESVAISEIAPGELQYMITAIEGPELGDWTGFFKALADVKADIMERITVGDNQILIILTSDAEGIELSEATAYTIWACDLIDSGLVDTAIVC
ncbi:MAG: hypothetical protein KKH61_21070, partial [Gammaproteobacteria bacterium]|nr:hypothetical protein [Gammaproteobacteria bacterium]